MNPLLATGHISIFLLLAGLFFPRLALFFAWFFSAYPPNTLSVLLNFVCWLFVPRFLMAYYISTDVGTNNLWFCAYVVTGIIGFLGETGVVHRRTVRRRVIRNRAGTTVIDKEV